MAFTQSVFFKTLASAAFLFSSASAAISETQLRYEIQLDGKSVGTIDLDQRPATNGDQNIKLTTQIQLSGFWNKINILSVLQETVTKTGLLREASNKLSEGNKTYWTKIEHSDGEYLAFTAQMKNQKELENEEILGLAQEVVASVVPYAGETMAVAQILLSDEKDSPQHRRLTSAHFDTTLIGLPHYWQRNGKQFPTLFRILDTENMSVFEAKMENLGAAQLSVGGTQIPVHHYRLRADDDSPLDIWFAMPKTGPAYFARLKGKEDGAAFNVQLTGTK